LRRKSNMKITRNRLEEERQKTEERMQYQRVMLIMLPIIMVAVLVIGVYFGYLSYADTHTPLGNIDNTPVTTKQERSEQENEYLLTIVSSANPVDKGFVPALEDFNGVQVSSLVCDDLELMVTDAKNVGVNLVVSSGYISFEEQKKLYDTAVSKHKKKHKSSLVKAEAAVKKTIPNAGECEQQTGLVVKFSSADTKDFAKSDEYSWLLKNSVDYGFVLRYPDKENTGGIVFSPDLFRYVGVENALLMRSYNMNLDEFVQYLGAQ